MSASIVQTYHNTIIMSAFKLNYITKFSCVLELEWFEKLTNASQRHSFHINHILLFQH